MYKRNLTAYFVEMGQSENINTIRLDSYIQEKTLSILALLK